MWIPSDFVNPRIYLVWLQSNFDLAATSTNEKVRTIRLVALKFCYFSHLLTSNFHFIGDVQQISSGCSLKYLVPIQPLAWKDHQNFISFVYFEYLNVLFLTALCSLWTCEFSGVWVLNPALEGFGNARYLKSCFASLSLTSNGLLRCN